MDIQKEKHNYLAMLVAEDAITQEQCSNLSLYNGGNFLHSDFLASSKVDCINWGWSAWLKAKAQAVPEGYVLVPREMQWHKADDLACLEWGRHVGLFCSENRDMSALQVEEFRLRWCKNKANKIMSDYKAMIEAQEPQITELKVEWASDCFKCGHHEAIIYSTAAEASTKGWFHDGDEAKCTGCGNTGEMDAQGEDSGILWNEDEEAAKNA